MAKRKHHEEHEGGELQVGQTVWYYPAAGKDPGPHPDGVGQPLLAIVASVVTPQSVNLHVIRADGESFGAQCVLVLKSGESALGNAFCSHERMDAEQHVGEEAKAPAEEPPQEEMRV